MRCFVKAVTILWVVYKQNSSRKITQAYPHNRDYCYCYVIIAPPCIVVVLLHRLNSYSYIFYRSPPNAIFSFTYNPFYDTFSFSPTFITMLYFDSSCAENSLNIDTKIHYDPVSSISRYGI